MSEPKRGRGRPPKRKGEAKSTVLALRLTYDERNAIDQAAQRVGLIVSEWARRVLLDEANTPTTPPAVR